MLCVLFNYFMTLTAEGKYSILYIFIVIFSKLKCLQNKTIYICITIKERSEPLRESRNFSVLFLHPIALLL